MTDVQSIGRDSKRVGDAVAHWSSARWRLPATDGTDCSRYDVMRFLIQYLADLSAIAEGEDVRVVPAPEHDTGLADQLTVITADLVEAEPDPELCDGAAWALTTARAGLFETSPTT